MKPLRVAAFQRRARCDDMPAVLARLSSDLAMCERQGIDLAVFPECYLQGYSSTREAIAALAISTEEQAFADLLALSAGFQTTLIIGFIERKGLSFYNSAAVMTKGRLDGSYAKIHTNEPGFDAGDGAPVFVSHDWRLAVNICNDANFPETALRFSRQGIRLLCYPLNNMLSPATAESWRQRSLENLRQRAIDTGCWIISSDVVGEQDGKISYGCTCIVTPDGGIAARVTESVEGEIVHELF